MHLGNIFLPLLCFVSSTQRRVDHCDGKQNHALNALLDPSATAWMEGAFNFPPLHQPQLQPRIHLPNDSDSKQTETSQGDFNFPTLEPNQNSKQTEICANSGKTAKFMLAWPSITTFSLVEGWNEETTTKLKNAVKTVLSRNPILTGKASVTNIFDTKINIIPSEKDRVSEYVFETKIGMDVLSTITNLDFNKMKPSEPLDFMDEYIAPLVPSASSTFGSIKDQKPLFRIDVIQLPNNYACYAMTLSHCVGDGVTYYNLMEEINRNMNKMKPHHELVWSHPSIENHEVFPERFSKLDTEISYGFPFFIGLVRNMIFRMKNQRKSYIFLDKNKIEAKKKGLQELGCGHLSDNDIITAALCEGNKSSDIFAFTMNMRDRHDHFGGNFHNEIPFKRESAEDPVAFRQIVKKGYYYEHNELPFLPFLFGDVGRISSLASVQKGKLIQPPSTSKIVCHSMLSSFVENVPLDTAFISSMNDSTYVVLHNFRDVELKEGSLGELQC